MRTEHGNTTTKTERRACPPQHSGKEPGRSGTVADTDLGNDSRLEHGRHSRSPVYPLLDAQQRVEQEPSRTKRHAVAVRGESLFIQSSASGTTQPHPRRENRTRHEQNRARGEIKCDSKSARATRNTQDASAPAQKGGEVRLKKCDSKSATQKCDVATSTNETDSALATRFFSAA